MNIFHRLQGIFFSPEKTFKFIANNPVWVDALLVLLVASVIFSYVQAPYSQQDTIQLMKNNIKLKERLGEERFNQMIERMETQSTTGLLLRSFLFTPLTILLGILLSSLILLVLGGLVSSEGKYVQIFSAYIHANFVDKILGNALRLFLIVSEKSVFQVTTSLAIFFPHLEVSSTKFIILSQVDFFQLWLFGILGYALSYILKTSLKKALFISYGFWILKSLFYIVLGLLTYSFMG